jgi:hypothetical protein
MRALLELIEARVRAALPYLSWVGVLDNELLPPPEPPPPFVGIRDGGLIPQSRPGLKDIETLSVLVIPYQRLLDGEPGASVMGSPTLGDAGTGLLDLSEAIKDALTDYLFDRRVHWAHRDRMDATQTLQTQDGALLQMQRNLFTYRRYV